MKYLKTVILTVLLSVICGSAHGQFNIRDNTRREVRSAADTVRSAPQIRNDYFSRARHEAERRALRKERNSIEFNTSLQLSQTQFSNWASGGDNTFSGRATMLLHHRHQRKKFGFETKFEARFGINHIDKRTYKNEDEFRLNGLMTWKINDTWSYSAQGNLRSQFVVGRKSRTETEKVSTFMAPGFLDLAVGFTYDKKPFKVTLSPVGGSAVFVLDETLSNKAINGVEEGKRQKWQVGPSVRVNLDTEFGKKTFRYRSELYAFTNLKNAPNMRWEHTLDIRATKFLTTTLYALAYYDRQSSAKRPNSLQLKYSISVGLSYTFKNK